MTIPYLPRPGALALLLLAICASPGAAQELLLSSDPMDQARTAMARNDPAEALSRYLRALSARPKDLEALIGAGRAALDIGDPSAAIGFFARAEEIAPRNGRVKAGLGSAMLQMENAKAALKLFGDATDLGVAPGEIASDRGLAYDLRGDNRRAQQDYALALRTRDDAETRRRLALSLAITGDRAGALAILDPLLRRQDVPAWRTRAFVLALTGDLASAENGALAVMPKPQASALIPFLARLRTLKPQQQAAAVHFGHFPSDGRRYSEAELFASAPPPDAPRPDAGMVPLGAPLGRGGTTGAAVPEAPPSAAPRRRPGSDDAKPAVAANSAPHPQRMESARMQAVAAALRALPPAAAEPSAPAMKPDPVGPPAPERRPEVEPGFVLLPAKPAATHSVPVRPEPKVAAPDLKAKLELKPAIPAAQESASRDAKAKDQSAEAGKDGKSRDSGKAKDEAKVVAKGKSAPERYWVQVAGGANKADLPKAYAGLKEKSPELFAGRGAWTTPLRATNRLLVGPFKTLVEAQAFVNMASRKALSAFTYTSPAGHEVEKLPAK